MIPFRRPLVAVALFLLTGAGSGRAQAPDLASQVEIRRTAYGVPHIRAENFRALGFALGYVQMEDYGERVARGLLQARAELARHTGRDDVESDLRALPRYLRALETYPLVDRDTRDVYEGFAAGVNRYIALHPGELPAYFAADFTGPDVHARGIEWTDPGSFDRFIDRIDSLAVTAVEDAGHRGARVFRLARRPDAGSNAWALGPGRTESGRPILLRNPHLSWDAGYYEAQATIPGRLNFYGDFRIGSPIGIIGGFNDRLGWATTNNNADPDEVYALDADPDRPDHYLFDGASIPLRREEYSVQYRNGDALGSETRTIWSSPLGPVIHRANGKIYVYRSPAQGEWKGAMQFLRMMQAKDLEGWKAAMRMRGRSVSNFTYADADGNILFVWNATLPILPHAPGGDSTAVPASGSDDVWTRVLPWDSLPQVLNPATGYVHNENDAPFYANAEAPLDPARFPANVEPPSLDLRSQLALELIGERDRFTLEELIEQKNSTRMLLADRVKDDLLNALAASGGDGEMAEAAERLRRWDNTASIESRASVLFETWWDRYTERTGRRGLPTEHDPAVFREPWSPQRPTATPRGLANPEEAVEALRWAMQQLREAFGRWDVPRGEVARARHGQLDLPVGGCNGIYGCFRVLWFEPDGDGRFRARGGDGWVLAVEFTDTPRAYSVLAYGQSGRPESPHHTDQLQMFVEGRMKRVAFTEREIERATVVRYRPGEERR